MPTAVTNEYLRKELNNFELNEDFGNLIDELKYSTLIVPIDIENEGCVMVGMNDEEYIPIFTDIHEYQKVNFGKNVHPEVFEFNFYLEILKTGALGFIVNIESERFPITQEFLDLMDTDYMFDLDYQPFTTKEIKRIHDSIDNHELEEFIEDKSNIWDFDSLMEILLKSNLLTVVASMKSLDNLEENGVISIVGPDKVAYCRTNDKCALVFSSEDKIKLPHRNAHFYTQLVNLPLFIDFVLKKDLAGIKLNDEIVISREFLMNFMKGFNCPCIDKYDDYIFLI